jgi:signal transduction histidine kinase
MAETQNELKSLITGPIIIISVVIIFNILVFLFWIVEDVTDSEDDALLNASKYLTEIYQKTSPENIDSFFENYKDVIEPNTLIFTVWSADSLKRSSAPEVDLESRDLIYEKDSIKWFYNDAGFFNRATYVIPYSFRKHATITWISIFLFIVAIWVSRLWIIRNRNLNHRYQLNEQWTRMGRVTSGLMHEIRNPLNAINVNAQLIEEDIVTSNIDENSKNNVVTELWAIQREVEQMDGLLQDFNDYSKPQNLRFLPLNVNHILENAVDFFKGECEQKNIKLTHRLNPELPKIHGDGKLLKRVFYNLILNAIQAMPEGGSLKVSTFRKADKIYINFTDSGVGIGEKTDKDVFEEFYSTKEDGSGLGLAIAKRIIENHNGTITVRPNRNKGVTFSIEITRKRFFNRM